MGSDTKKTIPIFLSSTYEDLKDYRRSVTDALYRLNTIVNGMEIFGSRPGKPKDECLAAVRQCRAYIGIFSMRYGSIDAETGLSMTHLEFNEAQRIGLPSLIYLLDEDLQPVLPKFFDFGEKGDKLQKLKDQLKENFIVSFFTTPEDLTLRISQDVPPLLNKLGIDIQPNILTELVKSLPRIEWLTDDRWSFIKKELKSLAENGIPDPVLRGTVEFLLSGDNLTAAYLLAKGSTLSLREAIDYSMEIGKVLSSIVETGLRIGYEKQDRQRKEDS